MEQTILTARTFNFDFSVTMFPIIISRLHGAYPRIKHIIDNCANEKLTAQYYGKWSIQQEIGHLIDLEELHHGRIFDFQNNAPELRAWDGNNKKTFDADHNSKTIVDLLNEFNKLREYFITDLLKFSEVELSRTSLHPRLKKQMRVVDMSFFVAEHDDHHIAKMHYLKDFTTL